MKSRRRQKPLRNHDDIARVAPEIYKMLVKSGFQVGDIVLICARMIEEINVEMELNKIDYDVSA